MVSGFLLSALAIGYLGLLFGIALSHAKQNGNALPNLADNGIVNIHRGLTHPLNHHSHRK